MTLLSLDKYSGEFTGIDANLDQIATLLEHYEEQFLKDFPMEDLKDAVNDGMEIYVHKINLPIPFITHPSSTSDCWTNLICKVHYNIELLHTLDYLEETIEICVLKDIGKPAFVILAFTDELHIIEYV